MLDITAPKQAISKSKNKNVVAFANDMVRDHEAVNKHALDLVKKLNVAPADDDTSKSLSKAAADKQAELAKISGAAATNPELKSLLQTGLKTDMFCFHPNMKGGSSWDRNKKQIYFFA